MPDSPHLVAVDGPVPLGRASLRGLQEEIEAVVASPVVRALLDAVGGGLLVLNSHRQIVAASLGSLVADSEAAAREALGLRPGEALGCEHAAERPGGCGAAEACRTCGALRTILSCQSQRLPTEGECLVTAGNGELRPFELRLRASPIEVEGRRFTVLAIRDASDEKRRSILERVFFHDILNSLAGLSSASQVLLRVPPERYAASAERVVRLVRRVESEICSQRALLQAEHGTLEINPSTLRAAEVLRDLVAGFSAHPLARERAIQLSDSREVEFQSDPALLLRVLTNMVTNALEATGEGGTVRVWCDPAKPGSPWAATFHVHNEAAMPRGVALHVFQRSFSTKGRAGRGLGTYAMKLLGERYLGGAVSFVSEEGTGTTFSLRLPARPPSPAARQGPPGPCF